MLDVKSVYQYTKDLNILYVEDDEKILGHLSELLINLFKHVDFAMNGEEGLKKYFDFQEKNSHYYDLVISDINMPLMNGLDMAKAIFKNNATQPIIITTAHNEPHYLLQAIQMGIDGYIMKPMQNEQLLGALYKTSISIFNDKQMKAYVEEIEKLNKQLQDKNKEIKEKQILLIQQARFVSMGEMIANISHQWRQPLNTIALLLQKLTISQKKDILDANMLNETVDKGMSIVNSMSSTIDDFRNFFKPCKDTEDFSIHKAIEQSYSIVSASLSHHNIKYTFSSNLESPIIHGFNNRFLQAIINILTNAKDAIVEKNIKNGSIKVSVEKENEKVVINIEDNAGGIEENIMPKIFDPYFTTKEEGKGTGIGLYMSKTIIEEHMQGKILVKNINNGACFTIVI